NNTVDDGSFPVKTIYDYYEKTGILPKTSGSSPEDNRRIFEEYPDAHIIHIAYSAVTTVSYDSSRVAAQDFENIHTVDSKNVSGGVTAIVVAAAKFIEANPTCSAEDIISFVKDVRERTRFVFLPKTLVYLKAGGRVSNVAFLGASLLKIHPSILLKDGYLIASKKYRGSYERCIKNMIKDFVSDYNIDPETVIVGGTAGLEENHKQLAVSHFSENGFNDSSFFTAGAVISSHGGPGGLGIVGIEKK
ncbi:MAG: DegV family EDD domain-containing protein, partial [Pisciglobus halotolerans]|nr:DegV family EDD domain-containing protein [Pisciglobus halotolerans]